MSDFNLKKINRVKKAQKELWEAIHDLTENEWKWYMEMEETG